MKRKASCEKGTDCDTPSPKHQQRQATLDALYDLANLVHVDLTMGGKEAADFLAEEPKSGRESQRSPSDD